ncbi:hypothetical protein KXS07_34275 [Inquilinus limosus]|uniref:hypothetical protein n=1 Tax=Inquilinus limosus TaxID=171674 RepID=UPI003F1499C6
MPGIEANHAAECRRRSRQMPSVDHRRATGGVGSGTGLLGTGGNEGQRNEQTDSNRSHRRIETGLRSTCAIVPSSPADRRHRVQIRLTAKSRLWEWSRDAVVNHLCNPPGMATNFVP